MMRIRMEQSGQERTGLLVRPCFPERSLLLCDIML